MSALSAILLSVICSNKGLDIDNYKMNIFPRSDTFNRVVTILLGLQIGIVPYVFPL